MQTGADVKWFFKFKERYKSKAYNIVLDNIPQR